MPNHKKSRIEYDQMGSVFLDGELIYTTSDSRDQAMFVAELKARLKRVEDAFKFQSEHEKSLELEVSQMRHSIEDVVRNLVKAFGKISCDRTAVTDLILESLETLSPEACQMVNEDYNEAWNKYCRY